MNRGVLSWRWLGAWLVFLAYIYAAAWFARENSLHGLAMQAARVLTPYAEEKLGSQHNYLGYWRAAGWQGPMVYLINNGHREPEMLRAMLLIEARRSKDWVYQYETCHNWDLRLHLIEECQREYPDDPLVAWAAGRIYLIAGRYEQATMELSRALDLGFSPREAGIAEEHFRGRRVAALLMQRRVDEAAELLEEHISNNPADPSAYVEYIDLLCRVDRYALAEEEARWARERFPGDISFLHLQLRVLWWSGQLGGYSSVLHDELAKQNFPTGQLQREIARMLLLEGRVELALEQLQGDLVQLSKAEAEIYALTGDPQQLSAIESRIAAERKRQGIDHREPWIFDDFLVALEEQHLRTLLLAGEWDEVNQLLRDEQRRYCYYLSREQAQFLVNIALEKEDLKPTEQWAYSLPAHGALPYLLNSSLMNSAMAANGSEPEAVWDSIYAAIAPELDPYWDYSNSNLNW